MSHTLDDFKSHIAEYGLEATIVSEAINLGTDYIDLTTVDGQKIQVCGRRDIFATLELKLVLKPDYVGDKSKRSLQFVYHVVCYASDPSLL